MSTHATTQKLNTLNSYKLMTWAQLSGVFDRLAIDGDEQLAAEAAVYLGFHITKSNIKGIRDALGIRKARAKTAPDAAQQLQDLQELAAFVIGIAQQLGMAVPQRVQTILER